METDEVKDLLNSLVHLTTMVQIRNAAKVQSIQAPLEDRKMWRALYKRCIVEIKAAEGEIVELLPSGQFQRRLFVAIG